MTRHDFEHPTAARRGRFTLATALKAVAAGGMAILMAFTLLPPVALTPLLLSATTTTSLA